MPGIGHADVRHFTPTFHSSHILLGYNYINIKNWLSPFLTLNLTLILTSAVLRAMIEVVQHPSRRVLGFAVCGKLKNCSCRVQQKPLYSRRDAATGKCRDFTVLRAV